MSISSTFENKMPESLLILCPAAMLFVLRAELHFNSLKFNKLNNFLLVKGIKGSQTIAKLAEICNEIFIMVRTRFSSLLINFQGSCSAKYLFPMRAKFIISAK